MSAITRRLALAVEGTFWSTPLAGMMMLLIGILLGSLALAWPKHPDYDGFAALGVGLGVYVLSTLATAGGALMGFVGAWLQPRALTIKRWALATTALVILTALWWTAGTASDHFHMLAGGPEHQMLEYLLFMGAVLTATVTAAVMVPVTSALCVHALLAKRSPRQVIISRVVIGAVIALGMGILALALLCKD